MPLTQPQFKELINELNTVVKGASGREESALDGLTSVAYAFGAKFLRDQAQRFEAKPSEAQP